MGERQRKLHGIMICVPYQGHLNPFVNLALKLASNGIAITFVHLEFLHRKLCQTHHANKTDVDLFSKARESGLDIRFTTMADPFPLEFDRDANFHEYWEGMVHDFPPLVDEFVGKILASDRDNMLHFLVADTVYNWPAAVARKYNLVSVSLWTQSALVYCLGYHWDLLQQNGHFPCKDEVEEEIKYVPGVESINTKYIMPYLKQSLCESVVSRASRLLFEQGKMADFVLQNTVEELELQTLSALNQYLPNYAVGPLNFSQNIPTNIVTTSLWSKSDCTTWLESKPPASVLYVSFGSFVHTNMQVLEELAYGLLLSQVNFVWVIRQGILGDGATASVLPAGFQDAVKERGLIIGWCDQVETLLNPAVGGFLTHSGWNSTLESMWCGVPMICYPIGFDQPCNSKLVVADWKIGIHLCEGGSLDRENVAHKIQSFMNGGDLERLKQNAERVRRIMKSAVETDGSSKTNFDRFLKDLEAKIHFHS
ncbi:UDP-glycosyltransferase 86A1-like isoform X2 [Salvia hispanica]|uniref:UDP-glycosyltransferase 86A1-like isoform X2 n=1 Tax=Salvia hispanica TaxID=49212 RepID=UPI002009A304|nr:UDP-glycosyltransferase 86A1-like isoform X2 [Salvia hispanica]